MESVAIVVLADPVPAQFPRLHHVWLDAGYNGQGKGKDWIEHTLGWSAEIVRHPPRYTKVWVPNDIPPDQIDWSQYMPPPGFQVLPRRWVAERTCGWQSQARRLSKDHELICATSEAMICVCMIRPMLRRLTRR
jgi:transposase